MDGSCCSRPPPATLHRRSCSPVSRSCRRGHGEGARGPGAAQDAHCCLLLAACCLMFLGRLAELRQEDSKTELVLLFPTPGSSLPWTKLCCACMAACRQPLWPRLPLRRAQLRAGHSRASAIGSRREACLGDSRRSSCTYAQIHVFQRQTSPQRPPYPWGGTPVAARICSLPACPDALCLSHTCFALSQHVCNSSQAYLRTLYDCNTEAAS